MGNALTRAATTVYRRLPLQITARRKIKSLVLGPLTRGRAPFPFTWRGMKVMLDPAQSMDMRLYFDGDYEPETLAAVQRLSPAGGTVIDVGANIGLISLWAARCVGPAGRVVAIEPSPWAMERLTTNARRNAMSNITPVLGASGNRSGQGDMFVINGYRIDDTVTNTHERVTFYTIDQVTEEHALERVDLIKIDTDGHEVDVLRGAAKTLERYRPAIIFEMGPSALERAGSSSGELIALLHSYGYAILDESFTSVDAFSFAARVKTNESANLIAWDPLKIQSAA
ncbi:FkbM family methyltransferase [Sphingomonas sp. CCH5-D11]|uniref:FkbM family methyltransferase n=1 Tax=Sphingomonas sp. CCH5-D11 TaxID=1768786 RepID=UPI00082E9CC0|nr:FkbM family methyltransferase [Sphingomonas sp. CCH5-D11]